MYYGARELSVWSAEGRLFLQLLDGSAGSDGLEYTMLALRVLLGNGADSGVVVPDRAATESSGSAGGLGGTGANTDWSEMETVRWWGPRYGPRWSASGATEMPLVVRLLPFDAQEERRLARLDRAAATDSTRPPVQAPLWFDCEQAIGRERLAAAHSLRLGHKPPAAESNDQAASSNVAELADVALGDGHIGRIDVGPARPGWDDPESEIDDGGIFEPAPDSRANILPPHSSTVPWRTEWRLLPARTVWLPIGRATASVQYLLRAAPAEQRVAALAAVRDRSRLSEGRLPRHMAASQRKSAAALLQGMRGHEQMAAMASADRGTLQRAQEQEQAQE